MKGNICEFLHGHIPLCIYFLPIPAIKCFALSSESGINSSVVNSDAQDIHFELLSQFPKLRNGGGFELLRAQEGGRKLLSPIVAPKAGYSVVDFCKENILAREDLTCVL